ncbi:hypothetical protein FN846DRAFT_982483 [Sphaerosporella brunnea]|uniref:DUF8040 domain-containing protein n=1 Tax=Sphaerosporella brunnea TaxID=1250544 RepID=A0A5J5EB75_9PEZI|nr:hypothetical protein FN846DRAFT_982483 [Sphaerosporella brunnea]
MMGHRRLHDHAASTTPPPPRPRRLHDTAASTTTASRHHHTRASERTTERRDAMPVDTDNIILLAAAFIVVMLLPYVDKKPSHTARHTGERYTQELLACGNERRIQENLRMEKSVFLKLCSILTVGTSSGRGPGVLNIKELSNGDVGPPPTGRDTQYFGRATGVYFSVHRVARRLESHDARALPALRVYDKPLLSEGPACDRDTERGLCKLN